MRIAWPAYLLVASLALCCGVGAPSADASHAPEPAAELAELAWLVGRWHGTATGASGTGVAEQSWAGALQGTFLEAHTTVQYEPTAELPAGEGHEERSFLSSEGGLLMWRQFHVEGFVAQYRLTLHDDATWVFESDWIANGPPGWRARETIERNGPDDMTQRFELARDGQSWAIYSEATLRRLPD